jgi:cell division protein FtsL
VSTTPSLGRVPTAIMLNIYLLFLFSYIFTNAILITFIYFGARYLCLENEEKEREEEETYK